MRIGLVNKLIINLKKTKYMEICCKGNNSRERSALQGEKWTIDKVSQYNYLGVMIDASLTYGQYMENVLNRVNQKLFTLSKVRPCIKQETSLLLYKQTVIPIMEYVGIVMDSGHRDNIDKLHRMQLRAIKCIKNNYALTYDEADEYSAELGLKSLETRRKEQLLKLMFNYSKSGKYVDLRRPDIILRNNNAIKFIKQRTEKEKVMRSPYYRGCTLWDQLTFEVQSSSDIYTFKKHLSRTDIERMKWR